MKPKSCLFAFSSIILFRYINEEKDKAVLRKTFEAYFPPSVAEKLMTNPEMLTSKGHKKELTVLISDIENFTGHTASMPPESVQELLNEYFGAMTDIVFRHSGTLDKFIGEVKIEDDITSVVIKMQS